MNRPVELVDPPSLSRESLPLAARALSVPSYDAAALRPAVVHLGLGDFARAHLACYLDDLAEQRVTDQWGLVAAGLRTAALGRGLASQHNLWTVVPGSVADGRVVGVLQGYLDGVREPAAVRAALVRPSTRLVTLTVTAAGYDSPPSDGRERASGGVAVFDLLAEALERRRRGGSAPFTVVSCDNLPDNGARARASLLAAAHRRSPALARWVERHVAVPCSMVDRISHRADAVQRKRLARSLGVTDALAVITEPVGQWVLCDEFSAGRPPLEEVGVQLVADVSPYVEAKTRLLNGSHVALGFLGVRAGHTTAAEAFADVGLSCFVREMMRDEVAPGLSPAAGLDLFTYQRAIAHRLADAGVEDPLTRLCRRGSVRIHNYVVPSLADALAAGRPFERLARVVAAWIDHLAVAAQQQALAPLEEPLAERLAPLALRASSDPAPLLAVREVFGDTGRDPRLVSAVRRALIDLDKETLGATAS
jgi:mannitol 2-dehydrogenase